MTPFDYVVLAVILLSAIFGAWRGIVKTALGLAGWGLAAVGAYRYCGEVAALLPSALPGGELTRGLLGFVGIFVGVLIVAAVIGSALRLLLKSVGLGALDWFLGFIFGACRGLLMVLVGVTLMSLTSLPKQDFWQQAASRPLLESFAQLGKAWLPPQFANWIKF